MHSFLCYNADSGEGGEILAVSEAKKKANAKWDAENMATLACKVKRTQAAAFKAYCTERGQTSNTALKDYVLSCIGEQDPPQRDAGGPQEATEIGVVSLPSETLKTAQEAAKAAGEGLLQFVARAIESRATLDKWKRG